MIHLARDANGKGLSDPKVNALLTEVRKKIQSFARPSWLEHSPHLAAGKERTLLAFANMQKKMAQSSDPASLQSRTFAQDIV